MRRVAGLGVLLALLCGAGCGPDQPTIEPHGLEAAPV